MSHRSVLRGAAAAGLLASTLTPSAAVAEDLLYKYKITDLAALKGYNRKPYWRVLAECAGLHGALSNKLQSDGHSQGAAISKARGVALLRTSMERLRADRGLAEPEALKLTGEAVDAGREAGVQMVSEPTASGFSHTQLVDLVCTQVEERHARAARFVRR